MILSSADKDATDVPEGRPSRARLRGNVMVTLGLSLTLGLTLGLGCPAHAEGAPADAPRGQAAIQGQLASASLADARSPFSQGTFCVRDDVQTLAVPYGVDVPTWLGDEQRERALFSMSTWRYPSVADCFVRGEAFVLLPNVAYPTSTDGGKLSDFVAWGSTRRGVTTPELSELDSKVLLAATPTRATDVAVAPVDALADIEMGDGDDVHAATVGTRDDGSAFVWRNASDATLSLKASAADDGATLSDTYQLEADGTFASDRAGDVLELSGLSGSSVYLKLARDMTCANAVSGISTTYSAGQVLYVAVARDTLAPKVGPGSLAATLSSGDAISADTCWISDGTLTTDASGIKLSVGVEDAAAPDPSPDGEEVSGVDATSAELKLDGATVRGSVKDSVATFELSASTLGGEGTYDLSSATVSVSDVAGNETTARLSDLLSGAKDATVTSLSKLRVLSGSYATSVKVVATGDEDDPTDADGSVTLSNAAQVVPTVTVADPLFSELMADATWNPLTVKVDGKEVSVQPSAFAQGSDPDDAFSCVLPTVTDEGRHTVEVSYAGAGARFRSLSSLIPGGAATVSASFVIDRTAPKVSSASVLGGIDKGSVSALSDGSKVLVSSGTTVSLKLADLAGGSATDASDVASCSVMASRSEAVGDADGEKVDLGEPSRGADGSYEFTLGEDGYYDLADVRVTVTDKAGNSATYALSESAAAAGWGISGIAVETAEPMQREGSLSYGFSIQTSSPDKVREISDGRVFYPTDSTLTYAVRDRLAPLIAALPGFEGHFGVTRTDAKGARQDIPNVAVDASGASRLVAVPGRRGWYQLDVPLSSGDLPDGWYSASFSHLLFWRGSSVEFGVDTTAPQVTGAAYEGEKTIASLPDGSRVLAGSSRTIRVRLQDLFPHEDGTSTDAAGASEEGTSGLDASSVRATLSCTNGLGASAEKAQTELSPSIGSDGWVEIPLEGEGLYSLEDIRIEASDECGNMLSATLADYTSSLSDEERTKEGWDFSSVLVDKGTNLALSAQSVDGEDTPASANSHYHRGDASIQVSVVDPWLPVYRVLASGASLASGTVAIPDSGSEDLAFSLTPDSFQATDDSQTTWTATVTLPCAEGSTLPREGEYQVEVSYRGVARTLDGQGPLTQELSFGVDYTAPELGIANFSETSPFPVYSSGENRGKPWGWVFATGRETGTLSLSDNLSGVDASTFQAHAAGTATLSTGCNLAADGLSGTAWLAFDGDGARMALDGSWASVADVAGNVASIDSFVAVGVTNLPAGATGIAIDIEAPQISVTYDNNDVRNGKYYNAGRTATFSVSESNFDLLAAYAPDTQIAAAYRDGADHPFTTLSAKDFSPVEQPDGTAVYVASIECDEDADWHLEASFTDPAGHASNVVSDDFVVDTTAPSLRVSYDNDDVANGMYYKASRTATIVVDDRNFSPEGGSIDAEALSGGVVPSVSGWSETKERSVWQATASFAGETHYQLKVAVTDLAGNVAEPYDSGEFVIDVTAPQVSIDGVANSTAYAGDLAPSASFSDTNLDPLGSGTELVGARTGDAYFDGEYEQSTATDMRTGFADVPAEPRYDDVYTYTATGMDLAGNTTIETVRFSVNRFGSTYYLTGDSDDIVGAYLRQPRDVQVVEVNVSGLDTSASRVSLATDDRSRDLVAGQDFSLDPNEDDQGWSSTTYTLPASLFAQDGFYRVTLTSTDAAGNLSQNTMEGKGIDGEGDFPVSFAVDSTAPEAGLVGLSSDTTYLDPSKTVLADGSDNLGLRDLTVYMDGKEVASWDTRQDGMPISVRLPSDDTVHSYRVVAHDLAGNESTAACKGVRVTGNVVEYVLATPDLLARVVGGAIVAVGIVVAVVLLARRRHAAMESRRNPFGH